MRYRTCPARVGSITMMTGRLRVPRFAGLLICGAALSFAFSAAATAEPPKPAELALEEATITQLQEQMKAGSLTSRELVEFFLHRIEALDGNGPKLNSI